MVEEVGKATADVEVSVDVETTVEVEASILDVVLVIAEGSSHW